MSCVRAALREELSGRLVPELRRLGFDGPPRIAGNALLHEFRRPADPRGTDVLVLQMEKHGRPRFLLLVHVEPAEGMEAVMARGGTVIAGAITPRRGTSSRHWFRADPGLWRRWTGSPRTLEREAVDACMALLPEIEAWWSTQQPTQHIVTWPVTYARS
jgi:hypothetical protein